MAKNRNNKLLFIKNAKKVAKSKVTVIIFGGSILLKQPEITNAMTMSIPPSLYTKPSLERSVDKSPVPTGPSLYANDTKLSDKIRMPAFIASRSELRELMPYLFLYTKDDNLFYKIFNINGGVQYKAAATLLFFVVMYVLTQSSEAFTPALNTLAELLGHFPKPVKYVPDHRYSSRPIQRFATREQEEYNKFLQDFNDPKKSIQHQYIMGEKEAHNLINDKYSGKYPITEKYYASDHQAAKHIYHAPEFGLNPEDYGMTKEDLLSIQRNGLTAHARAGRPLPPIEFVKDYQKSIFELCTSDSNDSKPGSYNSFAEKKTYPGIIFFNEESRQLAFFKADGDIISARGCNQDDFNKIITTGQMGKRFD